MHRCIQDKSSENMITVVKSDLSPGSCVGPMADPPRRRGHCTPPLQTLLHPHRPRSPPAVEEGVWAPQTLARQPGEVGAARLRLWAVSDRWEEEENEWNKQERYMWLTCPCIRERETNCSCWMHLKNMQRVKMCILFTKKSKRTKKTLIELYVLYKFIGQTLNWSIIMLKNNDTHMLHSSFHTLCVFKWSTTNICCLRDLSLPPTPLQLFHKRTTQLNQHLWNT